MKTSLREQFLQAIENRKAKMEKEAPKPKVKEETKKPTRRGRRKKILDDDDD